MESPPPLRLTASGMQWRRQFDEVHHTVWPLLCWGAIVGALVGLPLSKRGLVLALAWAPVSYLLSTASLDLFMSRHSLPTIPFVVVLATVALHVLLIGCPPTSNACRIAGSMTPFVPP